MVKTLKCGLDNGIPSNPVSCLHTWGVVLDRNQRVFADGETEGKDLVRVHGSPPAEGEGKVRFGEGGRREG